MGVEAEVADLVAAEQVEAGVAAEDAGELFVVGGFDVSLTRAAVVK